MTELTIKGMHCKSCVMLIQDVLQDIPGVDDVEVSMGKATVTHGGNVTPQALIKAIQDEGYDAEER